MDASGDETDNWLIHLMAPAGEAGTKRASTARAEARRAARADARDRGRPADALDRDDDWVFELKWDGIRALATISGDELTLRSRNGLDLTASYPELAELVPAFDGDGVVDGEIVALDAEGRPSFSRLQRRMGVTAPRDVERARRAVAVHFFAFDLLELDGQSLVKEPYERRRKLLREQLKDRGPIAMPPDVGAELETALHTSEELGLEGVMAKRRDSPYRAGRRSRDWIKLKHRQTQEVVIAGWRPGNGARASTVGSLLLGVPDGDRLRYVGRVGSGFTDRDLEPLRARFDKLARDETAARRGAVARRPGRALARARARGRGRVLRAHPRRPPAASGLARLAARQVARRRQPRLSR